MSHKINVLTHRGLEPEKSDFFFESTYEAFADQSRRGFGLEFDINFTADDKIIILHDAGLERITHGKDKRLFTKIKLDEIKNLTSNNGCLCGFDEIMELIRVSQSPINALHFKGKFQDQKYLDILITYLQKYHDVLKKIIIFDVKIDTARFLKVKNKELTLAPSVAHEYDIKRYNSCVNNTLISLNEAIDNKNLFDWLWLDEWDLNDADGKQKTLYNQKVFDRIKKVGFKISLVTPELHASSPGLLGGEAHQDAKTMKQLDKRLREIIEFAPDAICTDYPNLVRRLTLT